MDLNEAAKLCRVHGCHREKGQWRNGMCNAHYLREYRARADKACHVNDCGRPVTARGMCAGHYSRQLRGGNMNRPLLHKNKGTVCNVDGCGAAAKKIGLCNFHYQRKADGVPLDKPRKAPDPDGFINGYGYRVLPGPNRTKVLQHRAVMETMIGRKLLNHETVHHKNGVRDDNRPENLELWSGRQPKGQRVVDKVRWAREIISLYGALYPDASEAIAAE